MPEWSISVESCEYQEATYTFTANMVLHTVNEEDTLREKVMKKKYFCKNNKRKKQQPFPDNDTFKFSDYDCIGFDLDNTICRYKVGEILRLEYNLIADYMVNRYGYEPELLLPLDDDMDFLQKGLIMDIKRGNFLKCSDNGRILRATHGTRPMTRDEIHDTYGKDRIWEPVLEFMRTLSDHPVSGEVPVLRSFKDYFDMPAAVACARAIDAQDSSPEGPLEEYDIWPDVHVAMCNMYRREHFRNDLGGFFPEMKTSPEKYIYEASEKLKKWLKSINEHTFTFLISGSSIDYASHCARYVLGPDWRDYFDTMICTAKKPGFFSMERPFRFLVGADDAEEVPAHKLRIDGTYSGGNWNDLLNLVKRETCVENPHCLYVGDHLAQDVMAPSLRGIDTVAIVEELAAEGMIGDAMDHDSGCDLMSSFWGSFFTTETDNSILGVERVNTLYASLPLRHARLAVPSLEAVARNPIKHQYEAFSQDTSGFFPGDPVILHF
ncbi:5'-nucleotidase domain-containing protein 1-like [Homarus americanus]|uniref:5'-nucleotidase domain-containing protein 1 n=1 Tax=Homarus americanus TaxID=6706 RepID=A0A8J5K498_HOMAM|nr:5'-nucleotidase domain-containing protein 1-like [Homarus americanus]KAG7170327.1 5'-nucleotidase domain-containing protein 1-like [Homarus americanus]